MKRYTKTHEWIEMIDERIARVGITDHAQEELGDIVYVDFPEVGKEIKKGEAFMTIESVKAASDIYAPASGKVVKLNEELNDKPELVNEDAEGKGWLVEIELKDPSELDDLMSKEEYENFLQES